MRALMIALVAAWVLATPADAVVLRSQERSYETTGIEKLSFDFSVGQLVFESSDGDLVQVILYIECDRRHQESCERRAKRIRLESDKRGRELSLKVRNIPKFNFGRLSVDCRVKVPKSLDLEVNMGVGELVVQGVGGNLNVDLGVGEARVEMPGAKVSSVRLEVGIGEANLHSPTGRRSVSGLFGRKLSWSEGAGTSQVHVDVGVGEALVSLD